MVVCMHLFIIASTQSSFVQAFTCLTHAMFYTFSEP